MRKGSSSHAFVRASIGSQTQTWGMSISQACHLASGAQRLGDAYGGHCKPPTDKKLQAIYNTAGRSWANISCPLPTPLDLQAVCLNSHWANRSQISAEIRGTVQLR